MRRVRVRVRHEKLTGLMFLIWGGATMEIALQLIRDWSDPDKTLDLSDLNLTVLPPLPPTLKALNCELNALTSLPELPPTLEYLYCCNNRIRSLPELPATLTSLWCTANQLSSLPALPAGLRKLVCSANSLSELPDIPDGITVLTCSYNPLRSIPEIPASVEFTNFGNICLPFHMFAEPIDAYKRRLGPFRTTLHLRRFRDDAWKRRAEAVRAWSACWAQ